jgi:hypothetical protein
VTGHVLVLQCPLQLDAMRDQAMNEHADITGRDDYLLAHALHEAIKALAARPEEHRPESNIEGMRRILLQRYRAFATHFAAEDDLKAALAELPEGAGEAEVKARIRAWSEEWNRHGHRHPQAG